MTLKKREFTPESGSVDTYAFETRQEHVYRGPFISEDGNFDLSTALFHVTMSHGKSVQAPIRL